MMTNESQGTVLVTGGSRGIGAAVVLLLARQGLDVCFTYLKQAAAADEVVRRVRQSGGRAWAIQADSGDPESASRILSRIPTEAEPLVGLVNNAGITGRLGSFVETDLVQCFALSGTYCESPRGQLRGACPQAWWGHVKATQQSRWPLGGSPCGKPGKGLRRRCASCQGRQHWLRAAPCRKPFSGFYKCLTARNTALETMRRVFEVNVLGVLALTQNVVRRWLADGRHEVVVNVSSIAATLGAPGEYVHYAASKAAIEAFTIGLGKELAPRGIRVNCVSPGTSLTDIHATAGDADRPARVASRIPMGRAGEPREIAEAIAWLVSSQSSYVTGSILRVAGGL